MEWGAWWPKNQAIVDSYAFHRGKIEVKNKHLSSILYKS
jgi:hypothetical protein